MKGFIYRCYERYKFIQTMRVMFDLKEVDYIVTTIDAYDIDYQSATQILSFGCPPHALASAWFLAQECGDIKGVAMLCSKGKLYEALEMFDRGNASDVERLYL